ncbi:hypothetical protein MB46_07405 [Arthrobacter alpinus]|nr:hypothetical protein MB46_07405 [Arthrobacter alpinus]
MSLPSFVDEPVQEQVLVSMKLLLPEWLVHQLHSALAVAGKSEGYLRANDLFVEAIHQEVRRLQHSYNSNANWPEQADVNPACTQECSS